jgi:molybdopterin converting factor small subunit
MDELQRLQKELREERATRSRMWREWNQEKECVVGAVTAFLDGNIDAATALDEIASDLGIDSESESEPGICEKCGVQQ